MDPSGPELEPESEPVPELESGPESEDHTHSSKVTATSVGFSFHSACETL